MRVDRFEAGRRTFVFDLDGTVLNSKNEFPPETRELILSILSKGDNVVFATGRMHISATRVLQRVFPEGIDFPIISYNGAVVYVPGHGFVYEKRLKLEIAWRVIDFFRPLNIHIQSYAEDMLYGERETEEIKLYSVHAEVPYTIVDDLKKLGEPIKMLAIADPAVLDELTPRLKTELGDEANVFKSFPFFLDIVPPDANKGSALRFLAEYLGFDLGRTIVFGDNENDLYMFEVAGTKIAVENAVPKLKEAADFVTKSNDENGVYSAFATLYPEYIVGRSV